ncbi:MAG: DUF1583 domain-containing protein [Planctomycetota bacterium]
MIKVFGIVLFIRSLICATIAVVSGMVVAHVAHAADSATAAGTRQEVGRTVILLLRDGDIEQALKSIEAVSDGETPNTLVGEEGYSSAGAGLHRALAQLSSEAQFELLSKWSMPVESPAKIRVLTVLVPTLAPPVEFARALGERPRGTSFPVSSIGEVRGIFSTAWSLVVAARESGRLKRLMTDVGPLVDKKVPNADLLLALAQIADSRGDLSKVTEAFSKRVIQLKGAAPANGAGPAIIDPADVVIACAALQHPTLRPLGEEMLAVLLDSTHGRPASRVRPFLRQAHATAMLTSRENAGELGGESKLDPRLKYWVPVSGTRSGSNSPVMTGTSWLVYDDHLLHLSGAGHDAVMLRYPVEGDFGFQCETQIGGRVATDGQLIYGGLGFQVLGTEFHVTDSDGVVLGQRPCPFVRPSSSSSFNRLSIASMAGSTTMLVNLHPMWTDKSGFQASPWLGLGSFDESRPLFRNMKLTGQPVIPRSVRLIDGQVLRGWHPQVFGDRSNAEAEGKSDWRLVDGVLGTANNESKTATKSQEQVLFYQRPLLDGETVSYEFFYKPGECDVSPTLGRVAFLLQPEGVRIRWLTDGQWDWTGLAADNTVTEPLNRRGPRPLPLRANAWNRATIARTKDTVTLSLDDVVVYQRPIDWSGDHRFGLDRHDSTVEVKVRNVVLTGDWPRTLPQEFLDNPLATVGEPMSVADRHALSRLFQEEFLTENLFEVHRKALAMPAAERFEFLSRWILPGPVHPGFRVSGDFTPTRPPPLAVEPGVVHPEAGGQIVSPVLDWIDVARELGRLAECRQRVEAVADSNDEFQRRAKVALLLLISLEQKESVANDATWEKLFGLLKNQTNTEGGNHWPELLVAARGAGINSPDGSACSELISDLARQWMLRWHQPDLSRWHTHLASLNGKVLRQRESAAGASPPSSTEFHQWIPASAVKARTAGLGHPDARWIRRNNRVVKVSGHEADYLYYHLPLSGNYQVECDLILPTLEPVAIMVGGTYIGPLWSLDALDNGSFRAGAPLIQFLPKMTDLPKPMRYRAVIQDGISTIYLNGRKLHTTPLPSQFDPWIAIRSLGRHRGCVENLRILGQPTVLNAVELSRSHDLTGWLEYYEEGRWEHQDKAEQGVWIVGHSTPAWAGSYAESLLRYQRPLVEGGTIEYEFIYQPGDVEVCPALDRLAFLLHPSGVREHWITDGKYGPVELRPDNVTDVPKNRRGPTKLPLLAGKWNRLILRLRGATVAIHVNGELVYERELEPLNQRTFGLFHYADATGACVRNVVLHGDWPKVLPLVAGQELAGKTTDWADADLPRLKSVFTHSFEKEGLPGKYFELPSPNLLVVSPEGVRATQNSEKDPIVWEIIPRFALSGDFDIETSFSQIKLETRTQYCGILLRTILDDPQKPCYDLHRIMTHTPQQLSQASVSFIEPSAPGAGQWRAEVTACETDSGRLRFARRGKKLSYLFAEGDSETFRLFGTEEVSQSDTIRHGVRLQTFAFGGKTNVVWKNVTLRAERMTWFPVPSQANVLVLKVVQADGSGIRTVAEPSVSGFKHVGSPEWSTDGRKIAVDMSNGGTETSHIFVMNADGTERRDLGTGCMPSFSADGKRIAFSESGQGIMTMKSDGTDRQVIDRSGWGTQWSPDGKWIAYGKSGNITLLDVATRNSRQLLVGNHATRYGYIYWNLAWSHDSRGVAFKGKSRAANQDELAFAEVDSPDGFHVLQSDAKSTYPDISFSPDSQQVIAAMDNHDGKGYRLHSINIKQPGLPKLLDAIPASESVDGVAWSRDGKSIAISVLDIARPTEWVTGMKTD